MTEVIEDPHNHLPADGLTLPVKMDPEFTPIHHHHGFKGHILYCPSEDQCIDVISDFKHWIHPWKHTH